MKPFPKSRSVALKRFKIGPQTLADLACDHIKRKHYRGRDIDVEVRFDSDMCATVSVTKVNEPTPKKGKRRAKA